MVFGYDTLVNGAAISMPAFLIYYGEMGPTGPFLPSLWTSLWTAMSSLAQVAGGVAVGTIVDRFGRRYPTVAAGAITMIGTTIQFATSSRSALLGGKILNGFGIGAALAVSTTYASEVRSRIFNRALVMGARLITDDRSHHSVFVDQFNLVLSSSQSLCKPPPLA